MGEAKAAESAMSLSAVATEIEIAGVGMLADPLGALFYGRESLLILADLHLEKGSRWAARGMLLPPWDTAETLARLAALLDRWRPRRVVALGDSFDDPAAGDRLSAADRTRLTSFLSGREWLWIAGNHDPRPAAGIGGDAADNLVLGPLEFRHEPQPGRAFGEIAGHMHPVARVVTARGSVRRRCFVTNADRCIMPAFGAFAGGLNIRDPAYDRLFHRSDRLAHVLGRERVYKVSSRSCAGESGF